MSYYIFFDESGKIDRQKSKYSYYGALGIKKNYYEHIKEMLSDDSNKRELHFQKFNLTDIERYLSVLSEVLNKGSFNVYLVYRDKALNIADRLSISTSKLRELLYIKIPERLIYRLLNSDDKIDKLTSICVYLWEQDGEELGSKKVSEYISKFVIFKTNFDNFNKVKIFNTCKSSNKSLLLADYEAILGFGRNSSNLVKRYLEELNIIYVNK